LRLASFRCVDRKADEGGIPGRMQLRRTPRGACMGDANREETQETRHSALLEHVSEHVADPASDVAGALADPAHQITHALADSGEHIAHAAE
jgi:hypothetical protein